MALPAAPSPVTLQLLLPSESHKCYCNDCAKRCYKMQVAHLSADRRMLVLLAAFLCEEAFQS